MKSGISRYIKFAAALILLAIFFFAGTQLYKIERADFASKGMRTRDFINIFLGDEYKDARPGFLSENQLMQLLLDSITQQIETRKAYGKIPAQQLSELSYESFDRYITAFRKLSSGLKPAYLPMSVSEKISLKKSLNFINPELSDKIENASFFWFKLSQRGSGYISGKLPFIISKNKDGVPCLDGKWFESALGVYDYSAMYFSAIDKGNLTVLGSLLSSGTQNREVLSLKTRLTNEYYRSVLGPKNNYEPVSWGIDSLVFKQRLASSGQGITHDEYGNLKIGFSESNGSEGLFRQYEGLKDQTGSAEEGTRLVYCFAFNGSGYQIRDIIPQYFSDTDFTLSEPGSGFNIMPGDYVDSEYLSGFFGEVLSVSESVKTVDRGYSGETVTLQYNDAHIILENAEVSGSDASGRKRFSGRLRSINLTSGKFLQGKSIGIGSEIDEILLKYPFLDLQGYTIIDQNGSYYTNFILDKGKVKEIRIGTLSSSGKPPVPLLREKLDSSAE